MHAHSMLQRLKSLNASFNRSHSSPRARSGRMSTVTMARQTLTGSWRKDKEASDSMDEAIKLANLSVVMRQAVKLIRGVEIVQDDATFVLKVFSVVPWFKVVERYAVNGQPTSFMRRDMRLGGVKAQYLPDRGPHGGVQIRIEWGEPSAGCNQDEFTLAPRGTAAAEKGKAGQEQQAADGSADVEMELHVYSTMNIAGQECKYRTVYHQ